MISTVSCLMKSSVIEHSPATARPALVIGYGNPLRGDDSLGYAVADQLLSEPRPRGPDGLWIIRSQQLTPEMAEPLSRSDVAIFVDAAADLPAGQLRSQIVQPSA